MPEHDGGAAGRPSGPDAEELAEKFRAYRQNPDRELRNEIVTAYAGLAHSVARRFARRGEPLDDLYQVASFALLKAVERFDPERGVNFTSFAVPTMLGEIKRHFRDRTWSAKVPRSAKERVTRLRMVTDSLTSELQRSPTVGELAERLDLTIDEVLEALEARAAYRPAIVRHRRRSGQRRAAGRGHARDAGQRPDRGRGPHDGRAPARRPCPNGSGASWSCASTGARPRPRSPKRSA